MSLYERADSAFHWYRFEIAGVEYRASTGVPLGEENKREALRVEARAKIKAGATTPVRGPARGIGRLRAMGVEDYEDAEDRGASKGYLRSLRWSWRAIDAGFGATATVRDLSLDALNRYVRFRRKQGVRGQSIRREITALKRICRRAASRGWIIAPAEWPRVKSDPPHPGRIGKLRSAEEIAAVLSALPRDVADEYRFAALTGLRSAELARIEPGWLEATPSGPLLRVPAWASKTRSERVVMLAAPALEIIRRRSDRSPIFTGADHQVRVGSASRRAGLVHPLTFRDLRVFYASAGLAGSGDAAAVQASLGHADLRTTQRYQRSTLERAAAVSEAAAKALEVGTGTRHRSGKSKQNKGKARPVVASQGTSIEQFRAVECHECAAELQRVAGEHAKGRHRRVGTGGAEIIDFPSRARLAGAA